jgi:hypothetical protein
MTTGIYSLADLEAQRFSTAAELGLNTINEVLQKQIATDNALVASMIAELAQPTVDQTAIWGTHTSGEMDWLDEYGRPSQRKQLPGITASFPLNKFGFGLGWTYDYFQRATGAEVAKMYIEGRDAYLKTLAADMMRALARGTNYTFVDSLTNGVSLAVKRVWNNDGVVPPPSPYGATFAGTHTHLNTGTAAITNASVQAAVDDVEEHGNTRNVKIMIALADKGDFVVLTDFTKLTQSFILPTTLGSEETVAKAQNQDLENQLIGYWKGGEEVWVKPFLKTHYTLVVATGMDEKALMYRQPRWPSLQGLRIDAADPDRPLFAQQMVAEFGFGVWNRGMAAWDFEDAGAWADMV